MLASILPIGLVLLHQKQPQLNLNLPGASETSLRQMLSILGHYVSDVFLFLDELGDIVEVWLQPVSL